MDSRRSSYTPAASAVTLLAKRRGSALLSITPPLSQRKLVRLSLIGALFFLSILLTLSELRASRDSRLIKGLGSFKWPGWVESGHVLKRRGETDDMVGSEPIDWINENGTTVFDHNPAVSRPIRLLLLTDYKDYLERMNTHTYEIADSALRHHAISLVDIWGPGWNGWERELDLGENVRRRMWRIQYLESHNGTDISEDGSERKMSGWSQEQGVEEGCPAQPFDLVWTISDIFKQKSPLLTATPCSSLLAQQLGDCHSLACLKEWYPHTSNITVTKYAFELLDIFNPERLQKTYKGMKMQLFGHSPDSGNEWDFFPGQWNNRSGAWLFGFTNNFYPIRTTINQAIDKGTNHLIQRFNHPGYFVWENPLAYSDPLETYTPNHTYYQKHLTLRSNFATALRTAKICVFDSSFERKLIRKYAQALLSGCVVAGDIPTEHEDALAKFMIRLDPAWDIEKIEQVIAKELENEEELKRKAVEGFGYARKYLTNTRKITEMVRLVEKYNSGRRGYDIPFGFSLRCRSYWSSDDSWRPPWCKGARGLE